MLLLIPCVFSFVAYILSDVAFCALKSVQLTGKNGKFKRFPQLAYLLYYETKFKSSCFAPTFSIFFKIFDFFSKELKKARLSEFSPSAARMPFRMDLRKNKVFTARNRTFRFRVCIPRPSLHSRLIRIILCRYARKDKADTKRVWDTRRGYRFSKVRIRIRL